MRADWIDELTAGEIEMHLEEFGIAFPEGTPRDTLAAELKAAYEREGNASLVALKERIRLEAGSPL